MDSLYGGQTSREQLMKRQLVAFRVSVLYLTTLGLLVQAWECLYSVPCPQALLTLGPGSLVWKVTVIALLPGVAGVDPDGGACGYLYRWTAFLLDLQEVSVFLLLKLYLKIIR